MSETRSMFQYPLRADRGQLDRLSEIAAAEHRTLAQKLRLMIDQELARYDATEVPA